MASDTASPLRSLLIGLAYAVGYGLLFMLGRYTIGLMEFSLWFPAAGLRFAALLIFGWPFALIAAVGELAAQGVLDEWSKWGDGFTIAMICGVAGPPLIYGLVALVLQRSGINLRPLSFRHTIWLLAAAIIAPALTAPVSTGFLHLADRLPLEAFWPATISFWVGDAVGIFMLAPVLVAIWLGRGWYQDQRRSDAELTGAALQRTALIEIGGVLAASIGLFILLGLPADPTFWYPAFLPVAVLSMRHHWVGAIPAIFTFNVMAAWVAAGLDEPTERMDLQVFLIVLSAAGLLIAALVRDRQRAEQAERRYMADIAEQHRRLTISDMASNIVHELTDPISILTIAADAGLKTIAKPNERPDIVVDALAQIQRQTARIKKQFDAVRSLARKADFNLQECDLRQVVEAAADFLKPIAKAHDHRILCDLPAEPIPVLVNRILIEQVVLNVGKNGLQAMGAQKGAVLTVRVRHRADEAIISIVDQGPGIQREDLNSVFEPVSNRRDSGMGIGLNISKMAVEQHEGSIAIADTGSEGTTFEISLPVLR